MSTPLSQGKPEAGPSVCTQCSATHKAEKPVLLFIDRARCAEIRPVKTNVNTGFALRKGGGYVMWLELGPQRSQRGQESLPHRTDWGRLRKNRRQVSEPRTPSHCAQLQGSFHTGQTQAFLQDRVQSSECSKAQDFLRCFFLMSC